jgi:hypothetical protein
VGGYKDKKYKKLPHKKKIQNGSGAKSYKRKGFLHEEMCKYLTIYEEAVVIYDFVPHPF